MHFTASAAIMVLVCLASFIDASKRSVVPMKPHRLMWTGPSADTNININKNKNDNDNFLFSSLFSELIADVNSQNAGQDPCDSDDDGSCFWKMIEAGTITKSLVPAQETGDEVAAVIRNDKPILEKGVDNAKRVRSRPFGSRNYNLNSNSNENSNLDYSSLYASVQQFLRNRNKKLGKETIIKQE